MSKRQKNQVKHQLQIAKQEALVDATMIHSRPAPICNDDEATKERDSVDYSIRITKEQACSGTAPRRVRVYADGVYDMFHSGHARQLMQVKQMVPGCYLIVGVCNDQLTQKMKGQTVMKDTERYEAVRHCRYVDELLIDAPWSYGMGHLEKFKIDFVAHDDIPYVVGNNDDMYKEIKARGMFLATQRTEGISTTDVIARIVRDYDRYVRRNLSRGVSRKDLNISLIKEKRIRFQEKYESMKRKGSDLVSSIGTKRKHFLDKWDETSNVLIDNFISVFGADGRLSHWWNNKRAQVARAIQPPDIQPSVSSYRYTRSSRPHSEDYDYEDDVDDTDDDEEEEEKVEADRTLRPPAAKRRALSSSVLSGRVSGR